MANRDEHVSVGTIAGGAFALYRSAGQSDQERFFETVGGCFAGWLGARLPDILDPPTCPNHRGLAHGVLGVGYCASQYWLGMDVRQTELRERARLAWAASRLIDGNQQDAGPALDAVLLSMAAGAVAGLLAGYISHLALDAMTAKSIPIVG